MESLTADFQSSCRSFRFVNPALTGINSEIFYKFSEFPSLMLLRKQLAFSVSSDNNTVFN